MGVESEGDAVRFTRTLAALKREGSNVLVTGDDAGDAHRAACEELFGTPVIDRRRAVVSTTRGGSTGHGHAPDDAERIEYSAATRSAAAASSDSDLVAGIERDLTSLGEAVGDAIAEADRAVGGLAAAQFRLCVDSLGPLLEAHEERAVFRFLHAVTNDVRAVDGMGHYHLPLAPDAETVRTLAPLFDAVVELRVEDEPQQRWRLVDEEVETEWLPL